jgi:Flp pilus assembly protein TadG
MSRATRVQRPSRRRQRAAIAVELAIVAIPLITMMLAAIEFGRAMYLYNQIAKATRDAARHLSGYDPTRSEAYPLALIRDRILHASNVTRETPNIPGLAASMIRVCDRVNDDGCTAGTYGPVDTGHGTIDLVRVEVVGYTFTPAVPFVGRLGTYTFGPIGTSMRQVL